MGKLSSRARWLVMASAILITLAVLVILQIRLVAPRVAFARNLKTGAEIDSFATAIKCYRTEYNRPPTASGNAGYVRALMHDNPRGISFLSPSAVDLDSKGEILDGWGHPFQIFVDGTGVPAASSISPEYNRVKSFPR